MQSIKIVESPAPTPITDYSEINESKKSLNNSDWKEIKVTKVSDDLIFQNREMSLYDKKEVSACTSDECIKEMRDFIWDHWNDKKPGYLKRHLPGEKLSATEYIFIEPNQNGEWVVIWKNFFDHSIPEYSSFVERIGTVSLHKSNNGEQILIYKSESGNILRQF